MSNIINDYNIYKEKHILSFKYLILNNVCTIMFRIKNFIISQISISLFKLQHSTYNIRDNNKVRIPLVNIKSEI